MEITNNKMMMGSGSKIESENQIYSLKWNDFERQLLLSFANLYVTKEFADCTLICEGILFPSHKIVLSMCSPYFRQILREHNVKHPTVIIDGVTSINLNHVLEFIYTGSVSVKENQIQDFIETAEHLCVDGIEAPRDKSPSPPPTSSPSIRVPEPNVSALNLKKSVHPSSSSKPLPVVPSPPNVPTAGQSFIEDTSKSSPNQVVPSHFGHFVQPPPQSPSTQLPVQVPLTVPCVSTGGSIITTSISIPSPVRTNNNSNNMKNVTTQLKTIQSQPLNLAKKRQVRSRQPPTSLLKNPIVEDNNNNNSQQQQQHQLKKGGGEEYQLSIKAVEPNIQLFTTPSGMIVTTAYGLKSTTTNWPGLQQHQQQLPLDETSSSSGSLIIPESTSPNSSVMEYGRNCNSNCSSGGCSTSQLRSNEDDSMGHHHSSSSSNDQYLIPTSSTERVNVVKLPASHQMALLAANRMRGGKIMSPQSAVLTERWSVGQPGSPNFVTSILPGKTGSASIPQPLKYTAAQVRALVDSVTNVSGPFVPCKLCDKVVKRERLRAHIYECHLVNGQKITCPYCGVGLKSKGSYRVHVWRHRKGSLKNPTYNTNKTKIRNV